MLKDSLIRQPSEEDPDEGIKDLVEIMLKKMVRPLTDAAAKLARRRRRQKQRLLFCRTTTTMEGCLSQTLKSLSRKRIFYWRPLERASLTTR